MIDTIRERLTKPNKRAGCSSTSPSTQSGERNVMTRSKIYYLDTSATLPPATLHERLGAVPVSAWEDELPILEACIRESQRISMSSVALRRNLREEIKICGRVVKQGDFLAYPMNEVHLNPEYYPEPHKYDPGRWLRPDSIPDAAYTFLGWGAGRHTCTGIKVAKLEMKLILAMFLVRYEFDLVDGDGRFPKVLPVRNRNSIHPVRVVLWTSAFSINAYRVFPPSI